MIKKPQVIPENAYGGLTVETDLKQTENYNYLDVLRAFACFAVILLHYSNSYNYRIDIPTFEGGVLIFALTRFCVPVFVMISGALLLGRNYSITEFYSKRLVRIIPPFILWSVVYIIYHTDGTFPSFEKIMRVLFIDGAMWHFWYIYMIIGLYLIIPFLSPWAQKKDCPSIFLFLAIWFIWTLQDINFPQYKTQFDLTYFGNFIGFIVLGYYVHIRPKQRFDWIVGLILYLAGAAYTYYVTVKASYERGHLVEYWASNKALNVTLLSVGMYLFIKNVPIPKSIMPLLSKISLHSLGIYLAHIIIRDAWVKENLGFLNFEPYSYLVIKSIIVLILSFAVVFAISRIPKVGKYISG
jgi:surface polysaccharide O-acyltransferase-like enzyme